jgi:mannose-6-phosphate isomerase-like protein (cupin superfamily)
MFIVCLAASRIMPQVARETQPRRRRLFTRRLPFCLHFRLLNSSICEEAVMEVKSTLQVINQADCPGRRGVTDGQTYQRLIGWPEVNQTDRVRLGRATYKPGTYEQLHWHPIEACYYVIAGHATVRDFNGKEFEVGPGSMIYAPPGIAGAHEWEVKEYLELLDIRATNETNRKIQYTVDKKTKRSYIDLEDLHYRDAISFKSHY